jgi:hypothetical protein
MSERGNESFDNWGAMSRASLTQRLPGLFWEAQALIPELGSRGKLVINPKVNFEHEARGVTRLFEIMGSIELSEEPNISSEDYNWSVEFDPSERVLLRTVTGVGGNLIAQENRSFMEPNADWSVPLEFVGGVRRFDYFALINGEMFEVKRAGEQLRIRIMSGDDYQKLEFKESKREAQTYPFVEIHFDSAGTITWQERK